MRTISILGTVGIPATYGGFETLVENLARFHQANALPSKLVIYCSEKNYNIKHVNYLNAELRYIKLNANGISSIIYDIVSLISAIWRHSDVILLLGVSGAIALPLVRLISRAHIVTNIDGIEWQRKKWNGLARWFLRLSERVAVHYSHEVIADNAGIAAHVAQSYGKYCHVIAYGGDHAINIMPKTYIDVPLPKLYALAICRIEPENNVDMILEVFSNQLEVSLVFVGNWGNSAYGQGLKQRFRTMPHLYLLDPIYDAGVLYTLRSNATVYVHGHSAGGTNPSLVEIMYFGTPIIAYNCIYNRYTTNEQALFFDDKDSLQSILYKLDSMKESNMGENLKQIALKKYTWSSIAQAYFDILHQNKQLPNPS